MSIGIGICDFPKGKGGRERKGGADLCISIELFIGSFFFFFFSIERLCALNSLLFIFYYGFFSLYFVVAPIGVWYEHRCIDAWMVEVGCKLGLDKLEQCKSVVLAICKYRFFADCWLSLVPTDYSSREFYGGGFKKVLFGHVGCCGVG